MKRDPTPRILFSALPEGLAPEDFQHLPGTHRFVASLGKSSVHESDIDLLVTFEPEPRLPIPWHVLSFGYSSTFLGLDGHTLARTTTFAQHCYVADSRRADADLVERTIVDVLQEPPRRTWYVIADKASSPRETGDLGALVTPLVHVGDEGYVNAFVADRGNGRRLWLLPAATTEPVAWVTQALRELHLIDPDSFPGEPDWTAGDRWATPRLRAARDVLQRQRKELDRVIAQAQAEVSLAEERVEAARAESAAGPWRLLSADGDELVQAVVEALTALGFHVEERDEINMAKHGRKLEDLFVTDPLETQWECLVEVKGYTKGVKANDAPKIVVHPWRYFHKEHGRDPAMAWFIVNGHRGVDPDDRVRALHDTDLETLGTSPGALIDTRDLFRALCAVQDQTASPEEVRRSLREARTRWVFTPPQGTD